MRKLLFLLLPILTFGNMAKPWVDGSVHSSLFGANNCKVIRENLNIKFEKVEDIYFTKYKIKYVINSSFNEKLPLLFIGLDLHDNKRVIVNGKQVKITNHNLDNLSKIKYDNENNTSINPEDLIYFEAELKEGENIVFIEYDANLEFNTQGFVREYQLKYSLYPSRFWESFGNIFIEIELGNDLEIINSNIGKFETKNNISKLKLTNIPVDVIHLEFRTKINLISKVLLYITPFGISILCLIIMFIIHKKLIKKKYLSDVKDYKYVLSVGNILIPILYYFFYFVSFDLIDFSLRQGKSKHGYVFLFIFTLPILMLIYSIITYFIDRSYKSKFSKKID